MVAPLHSDDRVDLPIQLFTGKGGVGKTTVAAAIAVDAARHGQRPLVVELGTGPPWKPSSA